MNDGPLGRVLDGAAEDFMGEWGRIALSQKDEAHYIRNRVDVGPVKVNMGDTASGALQVHQQSSEGIRDDCASGIEDTIVAIAPPVHEKMFGKVGGVSTLYFEEVNFVVRR